MTGRILLREPCPSDLPCASVSKRVVMQTLTYENEFDLHENELGCGTNYHLTAFVRRLVLIQR